MNSTEKEQTTLILKPTGIDSWWRPVYKDQFGHLWKDVTLGSYKPQLFSALDDDFDGEPDEPIEQKFDIMPSREEQ